MTGRFTKNSMNIKASSELLRRTQSNSITTRRSRSRSNESRLKELSINNFNLTSSQSTSQTLRANNNDNNDNNDNNALRD